MKYTAKKVFHELRLVLVDFITGYFLPLVSCTVFFWEKNFNDTEALKGFKKINKMTMIIIPIFIIMWYFTLKMGNENVMLCGLIAVNIYLIMMGFSFALNEFLDRREKDKL